MYEVFLSGVLVIVIMVVMKLDDDIPLFKKRRHVDSSKD